MLTEKEIAERKMRIEKEAFGLTAKEQREKIRYDEYGNMYLAPTKSETASLVFISILAFVGSGAIGTMLFGPVVGIIVGFILFFIFIYLFDQHAKGKQ